MDARHQITHVAHVGTPHHLMGDRGLDVSTEQGGVGHVAIQKNSVVDHLVVGHRVPLNLDLAPSRRRTRLQASRQTFLQSPYTRSIRGSDVPSRSGPPRDDVRLVAALVEDPVDPFGRGNVLPQGSHVHIAQDHRVQGVQPLFGRRRSVGCPTLVDDLCLLNCQAGDVLQVGVGGVNHHRRLHVLKGTAVRHDDLATATLLGRRAEDPNPASHVVHHRCRCEAGTQASRGDHVVPAGVPDTGQCVVFTQHRQPRSLSPGISLKGGIEAVSATHHRQALLGQDVGQ